MKRRFSSLVEVTRQLEVSPYKAVEHEVAEYWRRKGIPFVRELKFGNKYRVDFSLYRPPCLFLFEVDEHQHKAYTSSEVTRMEAILEHVRSRDVGVHVVFVRFNPDTYWVGQVEHHECLPHRLAAVTAWMSKYQPQGDQTEVHYFFYDEEQNFRLARNTWYQTHTPVETACDYRTCVAGDRTLTALWLDEWQERCCEESDEGLEVVAPQMSRVMIRKMCHQLHVAYEPRHSIRSLSHVLQKLDGRTVITQHYGNRKWYQIKRK